ncbi:serine/threonine-protein kinase [Streptomyces sp. NPDC056716]|uniref:serine/threonine-protein kinase n=1 Tax=unclassified Streptomyces TaxID=2593676 RepID=UPI0036C16255
MGTERADGRVIAGRYRLEALLGRGGMGVVWRATDELLGRRVAVKELDVDPSLSPDRARVQRERILREARTVARLHHPHLIVVHDVVAHEERPYLVMELIDGGSLADRLAADGPVEPREAARIGVALLGALGTAHAAGVLHRDLKPANVLIEAGTGRVVLTDFGVARVSGASTLTESGTFVGSPEYTAPERMSGTGTGPASDLWSLGALLCAAVSGESPFQRASVGGTLNAVVSAQIRLPAQARPLLPVVRRLLERDPERRLDAVGAERMLRAFLDTGRTERRRMDRVLSRRRGLLAAALLVAALTGAGVSAVLLADDDEGEGGGDERPGGGPPSMSVSATVSASVSASVSSSVSATVSASVGASVSRPVSPPVSAAVSPGPSVLPSVPR